jgi:hypothetical protein
MKDEDPKSKPENNFPATAIAARHGAMLPPLNRQVRRAIDATVKPNGPNGPFRALELLWPIARYVTTRNGKSYGAFSRLKGGGFQWNTGLASLDGQRSLTITWAVDGDGTLHSARKGWSDTAPQPFARLRPIPFGAEIHLTPHGLDQSMQRGFRHMSRDAVAMNLKNLFVARQASREPVQTAYYIDKNYNVYHQFFLADGQGSVAILRQTPDGNLYHSTTLSPSMAGVQVSLTNSSVSTTHRWHNDGSGAPGVVA